MSAIKSDISNAAREAEWGVKNVGSQIGEAAEMVRDEAGSIATQAVEKTKQAASYVGDKAEQATGAVGSGMESVGGFIREHTPNSGMLHNASDAVAGKLEEGGRYLEEHGLKGMAEDVTNLIKRNPIPALLLGVGIGFLIARTMRK